jgi:hypothetical protein
LLFFGVFCCLVRRLLEDFKTDILTKTRSLMFLTFSSNLFLSTPNANLLRGMVLGLPFYGIYYIGVPLIGNHGLGMRGILFRKEVFLKLIVTA